MPEIDLEPGQYKERKPKGWRWKLPWSHPEDTKLPLAMCLACVGFLFYFFANMTDEMRMVAGGAVIFAFFAGACFMWAFRD